MARSLSGATFKGSNNRKKTRQGNGTNSKPKRRNGKLLRGQGRG